MVYIYSSLASDYAGLIVNILEFNICSEGEVFSMTNQELF